VHTVVAQVLLSGYTFSSPTGIEEGDSVGMERSMGSHHSTRHPRPIVAAVAIVLGLLILLVLGTSSARGDAPNAPWPDLLPPLSTASNPQPGPQPGCSKPTMSCLDYEIQRMRQAQDSFGCDHRAVFATTYLVLTETLRHTLRRDPGYFSDRDYLIYEDALFAHYYFRTLADHAAGKPVPQAWEIAFRTAASGDANAAQDMLLGINAHVQRDMPYVMATLGLHRPAGSSRKLDHDRFNQILDAAYLPVVSAVTRRYDPMVGFTNPGTPADNLAGLELVKVWRENVWRNAERLLNATTPEQRSEVEATIETNAAASANMISSVQTPPGYRASRDAYCLAHTGRLTSPGGAPGRSAPRPPVRPTTGAPRAHRHRHHRGRRRAGRRHRHRVRPVHEWSRAREGGPSAGLT
jgi:hypothetical protein